MYLCSGESLRLSHMASALVKVWEATASPCHQTVTVGGSASTLLGGSASTLLGAVVTSPWDKASCELVQSDSRILKESTKHCCVDPGEFQSLPSVS